MGGVVDRVSEIIWNISQDAFEDGRKKERERIINLLEQAINENGKDSWLDAIELIKEEIK